MRGVQLALATLIVALCAPAGAWEPNGLVWPEDLVPIPIELHSEGIEELTVDELETEVVASLDEWNRVGCVRPPLDYQGRTDLREAIDEHQIYRWVGDSEEWGNQGTMVAGATRINVTSLPGRPSVDIVFNAVNFTWEVGGGGISRPSVLDPRSVITHETGHLLGLTHTRDDAVATMAAAYLPDLSQATLARDDKIGICELFWSGDDDCDTDDDCRQGERCEPYTSQARGETVNICGEIRGTCGDPCSGDDLNCEDMCLFTRTDFSEGYCSSLCETDDDCCGGFFCHNFGTPSNPYRACRIDPNAGADEGGEDVAPEDTGVEADADPPDVESPDVGSDLVSDDNDLDDAAVPPSDPAPKDCGCSQTPAAGGAWLALCAALLGLLCMRRRAAVVAVVVVAAVPLGAAEAQEMTFDAAETAISVHVVLLDTKGVPSRSAKTVISDVEERVAAIGGFEVVSARDVKRSLGRAWREFQRCGSDLECSLGFAELIPVERMIFVRVLLEEGIYTVDLEMRSPKDRDLRPYVPAPTQDLRDPSYLDDAVAELLLPPVVEEPVVPVTTIVDADPNEEPEGSDSGAFLQRDYAWYAGGAGAVLIATGGVFALLADTTLAEIQAGTHDSDEVDSLIEAGESHQLTANVLLGAGAVAIVGAVVIYLLTDEDAATRASGIRIEPVHNGAVLVLDW